MQPQSSPQLYLRPSSALDRKNMGKYEVLCRLATGGMAEIFLAYQRGLAGFRKIVVLKSILPDVRGEEELVRMFLAEAQITAQFNHPHIAQVFDLDIDGDVLFLAMEFVQGCTLIELARALDKAQEAMPIGFTLRAVRDTALALHYAHTFTDARGKKLPVIHRDVAEKNIMVTHEGVTKLLDFGIAKSGGRKLTMVGTVKGSTGYMSPEQVRGETVDLRSDVFSLGVVMHECLTGYRLFRGKTPEDSMMKTLEANVMPPSLNNPEVSPELDRVVLKALERDREHRFASALEFAREIERVGGDALWQQDKCGELVQRHFGFRQEQVRDLINGMQEQSGESGISQVFAAIQAAKGAPLPGAAGPIVAAPLPERPTDQTLPAPISEVTRAIEQAQEGRGRQDRTEELPAHQKTVVAPIDFALNPESDVTPAHAPEHVTDVNSAHVPANPPVSLPPSKPVLPPPPMMDPHQQVTAPAVQAPFPVAPSSPASRPPSPPSRRVMRSTKKKSRGPLYGLIALVWAAAIVAVMMVLQVGPFSAPPPRPVLVAPPPPMPEPAPELESPSAPAPPEEAPTAVEEPPAPEPAPAAPKPAGKPKRSKR